VKQVVGDKSVRSEDGSPSLRRPFSVLLTPETLQDFFPLRKQELTEIGEKEVTKEVVQMAYMINAKM